MTEIRILTADDILRAEDLPRELVEVPEWGGAVYVRGLTAWERSEFENEMFDLKNKRIKPGKKGRKAAEEGRHEDRHEAGTRPSPAMCMVNAHGDRLFNDQVEKRVASILFDHISTIAGVCRAWADEDEAGKVTNLIEILLPSTLALSIGELLHRMSARVFGVVGVLSDGAMGLQVMTFAPGWWRLWPTSRDAKKHKKPFNPATSCRITRRRGRSPEDHERILGHGGVMGREVDMGGSVGRPYRCESMSTVGTFHSPDAQCR